MRSRSLGWLMLNFAQEGPRSRYAPGQFFSAVKLRKFSKTLTEGRLRIANWNWLLARVAAIGSTPPPGTRLLPKRAPARNATPRRTIAPPRKANLLVAFARSRTLQISALVGFPERRPAEPDRYGSIWFFPKTFRKDGTPRRKGAALDPVSQAVSPESSCVAGPIDSGVRGAGQHRVPSVVLH